jgi:hypothetical protein
MLKLSCTFLAGLSVFIVGKLFTNFDTLTIQELCNQNCPMFKAIFSKLQVVSTEK